MAKKKVVKFKESIGLDLGSHSIKLVHLKKLHDGFKLLNYEIKPTIPTMAATAADTNNNIER